MKRINWGVGIAIFYVSFMVIMISMVIFSSKQNNDLVRDDYYAEDLAYESIRQKKENQSVLSESVKVHSNDQAQLTIEFPTSQTNVSGQIHLFRPSDQDMDQVYTIELTSERQMHISTKDLPAGLWRVKIDWTDTQQDFYQETSIVL